MLTVGIDIVKVSEWNGFYNNKDRRGFAVNVIDTVVLSQFHFKCIACCAAR